MNGEANFDRTRKENGFVGSRHTDLLLGMVSCADDNGLHYFLADLDIKDRKKVEQIAMKLVQKYRTGNIYVVKSGKGFHLISFSSPVTLRKYIEMLKFVRADAMFIAWIRKVGYGVLRISRRSSHMKVPSITSVIVSPYNTKENLVMKVFYLSLLQYEQKENEVRRVLVEYKKQVI